MRIRIVLALCIGLLFARSALAQPSFTQILDPTNPVVNDMLESGGASWIDLDGDGLLDLFVAHGNLSNQNNALFHNAGGFQFVKVTTGAIVTDGGTSIGGTWGDYDNDGHPDLFVANRGSFGNFLYHGLGDTLFEKVTGSPVVTDIGNSNSASWVDIDNDGNLDLYVVNFSGDDFLYQNSGPPNYTFTRVLGHTITFGSEFSINGVWSDYNNDNLPDLFVGNAGTQNDALWTNQGAFNFVRTTPTDGRASLGSSWGDYDNDGYMDLFVTNYSNQASILYHNSGPPTYALVPVAAGAMTTDLASSVGSAWGDVDNDGDLDLYVAHDGTPSALYLNDGPPNYTFTKVTTGPEVTTSTSAFGCSLVDIDGDGQLDLFVANHNNQNDLLYRNDGNSNHWLTLHMVGTVSNRAAIGTRVAVHANIGGAPRWVTQDVAGQTGYNSQVLDLHYGLGDATEADSVIVRWPSGTVDTLYDVPGDRRRTIVEGSGVVSAPPTTGRADRLSLMVVPSATSVDFRFRLPEAAPVSLDLYDVRGQLVARLAHADYTAGEHALRVARSRLGADGLYFCRISSNRESAVGKLVQIR